MIDDSNEMNHSTEKKRSTTGIRISSKVNNGQKKKVSNNFGNPMIDFESDNQEPSSASNI